MSDSEYEEEEIIVYADFKNQLMPDELNDPKAAIKIIGFETKNPIAEINGNVFKGNFTNSVGTNVFFEKDNEAFSEDTVFEAACKQNYKYFNKTEKVINFQRIYVEPKVTEAVEREKEENITTAKENKANLHVTYNESLNEFPEVKRTKNK